MIKINKRLQNQPACNNNYIQLFLELAEEKGWNTHQWLINAGIDPSILKDLDGNISFEHLSQFVNLIPEIWEIPGLGLELGKKLQISTNGVLAYAIIGSETYMDGVNLFCQFHQIREQLMTFELVEDNDDIVFRFKIIDEISGDLSRFCFETALSGIFTFLKNYLGIASPVKHIRFAHTAPQYMDIYKQIFGDNVEFNCSENIISVPRKFLERRAPTANHAISTIAQQQCAAILDDLVDNSDLIGKVCNTLYRSPWRQPTQAEVANQFCMSIRTLRRRLKALGTSYQDLVDSVNESRAVKFLKETDWPIDEISNFLGYSEQTNFNRAFKRWTGSTPASFRAH